MPDIQDRKNNLFSRYDAMSTDDLQAFLREDASKPMGEESDTKEIYYVMEVLAKRKKEQAGGKDPAEALASFKQNYYSENETPNISEIAPVAHKQRNSGHLRRGLIAAIVAICILIIGNTVTASALDFNLFEIIAKWTQETFHFGSAGQTDETNAPSPDFKIPCSSLQEALDNFDVTAAIVPSWIPDEYVQSEVRITDTPKQRIFSARYQNGDRSIIIKIAEHLNSSPMQVEQSESLIEIYKRTGIDYYIFKNEGQLQAVWINGSFECYISGPITISEIKKMIDSIEKG